MYECSGGECKFFPHCECRQGADFDELCSASCSPEMCSRNCPQWGPWFQCDPKGFRLRSGLCPCDHLLENLLKLVICAWNKDLVLCSPPEVHPLQLPRRQQSSASIGMPIVLLIVILLGVFGTYRWKKLRQGRNVLLDRRQYDHAVED